MDWANETQRTIMRTKFPVYLALVFSGGLFGCSTARHGTARQENPPLYVHFGTEAAGDSAKRCLSTCIHPGESIFVSGDDYLELKGTIDRRGTNLVADLMGGTGQEAQFYHGNVTLEKPFFGQGGAASGGVGLMWFAVSTNSDGQSMLQRVNIMLGLTNSPVNHSSVILQSSAVITNSPNQTTPNVGLSMGEALIDPITGLPKRGSGPMTNGLQMSLSGLSPRNQSDPEFEVVIRNVGDKDVCMNLGMMLANGKIMIPDNIHIILVGGNGERREFNFAGRPGVAGRVDDYIVPLKAGSSYIIGLRLDQFVSSIAGERLDLKPGRYEVWTQFYGEGGRTSNADMLGVKLMNFWKGKLQSNTVIIVR